MKLQRYGLIAISFSFMLLILNTTFILITVDWYSIKWTLPNYIILSILFTSIVAFAWNLIIEMKMRNIGGDIVYCDKTCGYVGTGIREGNDLCCLKCGRTIEKNFFED
jgi:hypothetical protein